MRCSVALRFRVVLSQPLAEWPYCLCKHILGLGIHTGSLPCVLGSAIALPGVRLGWPCWYLPKLWNEHQEGWRWCVRQQSRESKLCSIRCLSLGWTYHAFLNPTSEWVEFPDTLESAFLIYGYPLRRGRQECLHALCIRTCESPV